MTDLNEDEVMDAIENPGNYEIQEANSWPVGTILPVYYPNGIQYPAGWCLCAGQIIYDPGSPFTHKAVPNLIDGRFLMGSKEPSQYGKYGGTNEIGGSGEHQHEYTIRKAGTRQNSSDGFQAEGAQCRTVTLPTTGSGSHNHGGENRPQWFGLLYIIKYKNVLG